MATYGQLAMAGQDAKDRVAFESSYNKEDARRSKANRWGGWGRTLGLLGTGLGIAAMSNPLTGIPAAIAIGLGGLAGRSAGRAAGGGRERDADKNIDAQFYQGEQRKFAKEIGSYQEGVRERMLVDTGTDALSAFMMAKYAKPAMGKAGSFMKGLPEGLEAGKEMGLNPFQAAGDYARSFSPNAPFVVPGGAAEAVGGLASSATPEVQRAREMSEYLAGPEAGMFGEEDVVRKLSLGGSPATQGATPSNFNIMTTPDNPMGLASSAPGDLTGITNPLGAPDVSSMVGSPYSSMHPSPDNYGAAINRGSAMSEAGYLNDTIRQSLRLPTSVPDQMGGMNYQQWMGQSDNAFESFLNQGQEGNLLDMLNPYGRHSPTQTMPVRNY